MNFFRKIFGSKEKVLPTKVFPTEATIPAESELNLTTTEPSAPHCPYCEQLLNKKPQRKTKCPHCGQAIYVRSRPNTTSQVLVTEKEVKLIEKEWELHYLDSKFQGVLELYGISHDQYLIRKAKWPMKLNSLASYRNFIWPIFSELEALNAGNYHQQMMIYLDMARLLSEDGKDSFHLRQLAAKAELHYYDQTGVKTVEVLSSGQQSCLNCQKLGGKVFTINEALETMPIPCKDCTSTYGYCRCCYVGHEMKQL